MHINSAGEYYGKDATFNRVHCRYTAGLNNCQNDNTMPNGIASCHCTPCAITVPMNIHFDIYGLVTAKVNALPCVSEGIPAMGVRTAYDFSVLPRQWVRKNMTIVGDRLWREMNGTPCISLELVPPDKQEICTSRAFGKMTSDFNEVKAAVVRYLSSSGRKLRDQHSYARRIYVGIETNPFSEYQRQTFRGLQIEFPVPTDNTFEMIPYAMTLLKAIWPTYASGEKPFLFKRATVTLSDLIPTEMVQLNMFHQKPDIEQLRRLQAAVDEVNGPLNLDSRLVVLGAELTGQNNTWLRREMLSKCPTTKWSDRIDIAI